MGLGTIHPIDADLYWIQGQRAGANRPPRGGYAVLRVANRTYLLGSGSEVEQQTALHAVLASFPPTGELVTISSIGRESAAGTVGVDPRLTAGRHRHLGIGDLGEPAELTFGASTWAGWTIDEDSLVLLQCQPDRTGVAFYLPRRRVLALPDGVVTSGDQVDGGQRVALDPRVLTMLHVDAVRVLLVGGEAPWDQRTALLTATGASDALGCEPDGVPPSRPTPPAARTLIW